MRVLMPNTFHYQRGGDSTYTFSLTRLLESNGHEVVPFAMNHPENFQSQYSGYFISHIDYVEALKNVNVITAARVASRSIYSQEARKNVERLVNDVKPDIVHMQNIHNHLTPSILYVFKKYRIPVIWTLHDFKLICPNTGFLSHGEVCEKCKTWKYFQMPLTKCKKDSRAASFLASIEGYVHRLLRVDRLVDRLIAPSLFLKNKLIEYGIDKDCIEYLPNFINPEESSDASRQSDYFVYAGRLTSEKGVDVLIKAVSGIDNSHLIIAGDGPARQELEKLAKNTNGSRIEFVGRLQPSQLKTLVESALFTVITSKCYENCPYSVLESFAAGKPVIGVRIGGIPELIDEGITGLLFKAGDQTDLRDKIAYLLANPEFARQLGSNAQDKVKISHAPWVHYNRLMKIYRGALSSKSNTKLNIT